jgi:hypothetical protein
VPTVTVGTVLAVGTGPVLPSAQRFFPFFSLQTCADGYTVDMAFFYFSTAVFKKT